MAITLEQRTDLITALVGLFDAAPSSQLLTGFVTGMNAGATVDSMVNNWTADAAFATLYPTYLTNEEFAAKFVNALVGTNVDAAGIAFGTDFIVSQINAGKTQGEAALMAVRALAAGNVDDATFGNATKQLLNKVDVATYFATTKDISNASFAELRAVTAGVTADTTTVSNQKILIDSGLDSNTQLLTTGQDNLKGSAGNDTFLARFDGNENTAESGDAIDAGAGTDTLKAYIGNSQDFAVAMHTTGLEIAHFTAQTTSTDSSDNDVDNANSESIDKNSQVDAGFMDGTTQFWSTDSRANLTIEDVQTNSDLVTVGWRNSDSGPLSYEVYFDNITAPGATSANSQLFLELLDLDGMRTDGQPLKDNPYIGLSFKIGDETVSVTAPTPVQTTYAALVAGINALLQANPVTANVTATIGANFSAINSKNGVSYEGSTIVLTNTGPETLTGLGWVVDGLLPPDSNVHTEINNVPPAVDTKLTQTNVIFDYVGSGSKSGDFVAGEISQKGVVGNESGTPGIQQFNISVDRDSWANEVRSTNDTLEEVYVKNINANGSLRIDVLDDVRVFDASAMSNKVTLTADLNEEVIAKYLNLKDTASNPDADDVNFNYTTGAGDDKITLTADQSAVGHEDFILNVMTGAGNDNITVSVTDNTNADNLAVTTKDWYANQTAGVNLNELNIVSGAGNDYINVKGGGDYTIEAGAGDDTVFVDQTATKAVWALGTQAGEAATYTGSNADDMLSDASIASTNILYKTKLTIEFNGFSKTVDVVAGTNYKASQLTINNAIKQAIDTDRVLSDLLSYKDGPGNVLFIESKVDDVAAETLKPTFSLVGTGTAGGGVYQAADVTAMTSTEKTAVITGAGLASDANDAAIVTALNAGVTAQAAHVAAAEVEVTTLVGAATTFDNDSTIHVDAGDNVIALSSDDSSNNTIVFDTTWTKTSIIGFDDDTAGEEDVLDFKAYLTNKTSTSGSTLSETRIATTLNADATVEVNSVTVSTAATFTATDTFAGLTAAKLLSAINNGGTAYAGLTDGTLNAQTNAGGIANFASTAGEAVVMIHNSGNAGEYKVFQLTWEDNGTTNTNADFTAATLLGTVDFGTDAANAANSEIAALTIANLA